MTRLGVLLAASIIILVTVLLAVQPDYPETSFEMPTIVPNPTPPGVILPCPQMWTPTLGLYGGCFQFLPAVVVCDGCMHAWPVLPDGEVGR